MKILKRFCPLVVALKFFSVPQPDRQSDPPFPVETVKIVIGVIESNPPAGIRFFIPLDFNDFIVRVSHHWRCLTRGRSSEGVSHHVIRKRNLRISAGPPPRTKLREKNHQYEIFCLILWTRGPKILEKYPPANTGGKN